MPGVVLGVAYVVFVATIWIIERQPPALGETGEVAEAEAAVGGSEVTAQPLGWAIVASGAATVDPSRNRCYYWSTAATRPTTRVQL